MRRWLPYFGFRVRCWYRRTARAGNPIVRSRWQRRASSWEVSWLWIRSWVSRVLWLGMWISRSWFAWSGFLWLRTSRPWSWSAWSWVPCPWFLWSWVSWSGVSRVRPRSWTRSTILLCSSTVNFSRRAFYFCSESGMDLKRTFLSFLDCAYQIFLTEINVDCHLSTVFP